MGSQVWSLLSLGVGLNLVLGALVAAFKLPIYLDSVGTVLVAALAGPLAALLAGGCGVVLLGLTSPTAFAFLPVGLLAGLLSGVAAQAGAFRRAWSAALAGALIGCLTAALAAPIAAYLFGGVTGSGNDLMVALFRHGGHSALHAAFYQALLVDPIDKAVTFLIIFGLLQALPRRATAAFPLAERLPVEALDNHLSSYRPQAQPAAYEGPDRSHRTESLEGSASGPAAPAGWKLAALLSLLLLALLTPSPEALTLAWLLLLLAYGVTAPELTRRIARRLVLALFPLALSLILLNGLIVDSQQPRVLWLNLAWSPDGLRAAWLFLARVAMLLSALMTFLASTPLHRLAELLLRWRVPYPLVFVLLTGANLATRLRERWKIVEETQEARGLHLRPRGWWARGQVLVALLYPTIGAVLAEIPQRAANLESRGFLSARPKAAIPLSWTGEAAPTLRGRLFYLLLISASWGYLLWRWL